MSVSEFERKRLVIGSVDATVQRLFYRWINFWFEPSPTASLGILRILVGGMLIYSHLVWGINLRAFIGSDGWNSAEAILELQRHQSNSSFWWSVPAASMQTVHDCCMVVLVMNCIGFCTRITSILAFVIHVSYCQRAAMSIFGLDQVSSLLLLYLAIGPSGRDYSVDAWIARRWRQLRHRRSLSSLRRKKPRFEGSRSMLAGLSLRLIQVHYCVIYFFAATRKQFGESWWRGEALWRSLANYEYQSVDLTWMAASPFSELLQFLTHVALLWELSFAYLVWNRTCRPFVLGFGVLVHLGIGAFLGMWTFGLVMIFGYLAFIDPNTVKSIIDRVFRMQFFHSRGNYEEY